MGLGPGNDAGDVRIDAVNGHPRLSLTSFLTSGGLLHAAFLQCLFACALRLAWPGSIAHCLQCNLNDARGTVQSDENRRLQVHLVKTVQAGNGHRLPSIPTSAQVTTSEPVRVFVRFRKAGGSLREGLRRPAYTTKPSVRWALRTCLNGRGERI